MSRSASRLVSGGCTLCLKASGSTFGRIYKKYGKTIYITENGCPCPGEDKMTKEESVDNTFRQRYFSDHLDAIVGATHDGARIGGYFAWSLMDNLGELR